MKNRIAYKLIYYIVAISLVISSISIYIKIDNSYKNEIINLEKELNNIEKERLQILSESIWNVNQVAIDIFLKNLLKHEKLIYAKIIEPDGNIIEQGKYKVENIITKEFNIIKNIQNNNQNIGRLLIVADLDPLYTKLKEQALSIIITELIKICFIILFIIFFLRKILTNKIELMANYAEQFSLNNINKPLDIVPDKKNTNDYNELDTVVNAINTMRTNLIDEIKKSKEKDDLLSHQSKMAAMGQMISNIAHQWRQPLSQISTTATGLTLKKEHNILEDDEFYKSMDAINETTQYLSNTIDDFRNFFKPTKEKEIFFLDDTIDKSFVLIGTQLKDNNIKIIKNISHIEIFGFENELVQTLLNIFNNARHELIKMDKNKARLIFIDCVTKEKQVFIKVKDNAGGIPDSIISRIFEPYYTTKEKSQGTGIGLYMSQEIISKHFHGKLTVKNQSYTYEENSYVGAEFIITLNISKIAKDK